MLRSTPGVQCCGEEDVDCLAYKLAVRKSQVFGPQSFGGAPHRGRVGGLVWVQQRVGSWITQSPGETNATPTSPSPPPLHRAHRMCTSHAFPLRPPRVFSVLLQV